MVERGIFNSLANAAGVTQLLSSSSMFIVRYIVDLYRAVSAY